MGKTAIKHSVTLLANTGSGNVTFHSLDLITVAVGNRIASGTTTDIQTNATTGSQLMVGDLVKYINICIEVASRNVTGDVPVPDDNGWLEYAIVKIKEAHIAPTVANIGTKTLADICTTDFRGDTIFTGCIPVGASQPNSIDLKLKIPKIFTKMQWGSKLVLYIYFRSTNSADVRTNSTRVIMSALFKSYN